MLLKNHLIEVFKKASLENNFLLKENVVLKWVHRFGIDSLNDLLIHSSLQKENQEHISLIDEMHEEKPSFSQFKKNALPTDRPMDKPMDRPTNGSTDPLIEMRGRI